jgi:hypothetical protein
MAYIQQYGVSHKPKHQSGSWRRLLMQQFTKKFHDRLETITDKVIIELCDMHLNNVPQYTQERIRCTDNEYVPSDSFKPGALIYFLT